MNKFRRVIIGIILGFTFPFAFVFFVNWGEMSADWWGFCRAICLLTVPLGVGLCVLNGER